MICGKATRDITTLKAKKKVSTEGRRKNSQNRTEMRGFLHVVPIH